MANFVKVSKERYLCIYDKCYAHKYTDVNECDTNNGDCDQNCVNLEGSYECTCNSGFLLSGDGRICDDIDECLDEPCSHTCVNHPGYFTCECPEGYALDTAQTTCHGTNCFTLLIICYVVCIWYRCE